MLHETILNLHDVFKINMHVFSYLNSFVCSSLQVANPGCENCSNSTYLGVYIFSNAFVISKTLLIANFFSFQNLSRSTMINY